MNYQCLWKILPSVSVPNFYSYFLRILIKKHLYGIIHTSLILNTQPLVQGSSCEDEKRGWVFRTGCLPAHFQKSVSRPEAELLFLTNLNPLSRTACRTTPTAENSQSVDWLKTASLLTGWKQLKTLTFLEIALFLGCIRSKETGKSHREDARPATDSRNVESCSA